MTMVCGGDSGESPHEVCSISKRAYMYTSICVTIYMSCHMDIRESVVTSDETPTTGHHEVCCTSVGTTRELCSRVVLLISSFFRIRSTMSSGNLVIAK